MRDIILEGLSKSFTSGLAGKRKVLQEFDLCVEKGEVVGFLGPNGAGKSTVIKIILDFISPDTGQVLIKGITNRDYTVRRHIGYLSEHPCFYDRLTAKELLSFVGHMAGLPERVICERSGSLLEELNLHKVEGKALRFYSKGMLQRIGFAMALIHDPDILILDEPLSGLDPIGRRLVIDLLGKLKSKGKTIFFSSHLLNDIERVCDQVAIIDQGRLLFHGTIATLTQGEQDLEQAFLAKISAKGNQYA
ncbi:MAG: ABC transporter ATP-binding protein [Deltaproteobacteria bacterium]|nr:ABC transporter ATP-binding protein [Deltaproteobacteria bacterium]